VDRKILSNMVGVAQLVEHLVVVQDAAGSSPVTHPKKKPARSASERGRTPRVQVPSLTPFALKTLRSWRIFSGGSVSGKSKQS